MGRPAELTRQYLEDHGIANITEDGHVFRTDGLEVHYTKLVKYTKWDHQDYLAFYVYDREIYKSSNKKRSTKLIVLSRAIYAWYHGYTPYNLDVDHIDDDSLNNHISNLQLLTRAQNLAKRKGHINQYDGYFLS